MQLLLQFVGWIQTFWFAGAKLALTKRLYFVIVINFYKVFKHYINLLKYSKEKESDINKSELKFHFQRGCKARKATFLSRLLWIITAEVVSLCWDFCIFLIFCCLCQTCLASKMPIKCSAAAKSVRRHIIGLTLSDIECFYEYVM